VKVSKLLKNIKETHPEFSLVYKRLPGRYGKSWPIRAPANWNSAVVGDGLLKHDGIRNINEKPPSRTGFYKFYSQAATNHLYSGTTSVIEIHGKTCHSMVYWKRFNPFILIKKGKATTVGYQNT